MTPLPVDGLTRRPNPLVGPYVISPISSIHASLIRPMIRRLKREKDSIQLVSGYGRGPKSCPSMIRMVWTIPTGMDSSIHVINTSPIKVQNASSCHKYNFRRKKKVRNVIHSSYYIYNIIKYNSKNFRFVVY